MTELKDLHAVVAKDGESPLSDSDMQPLLKQIPQWEVCTSCENDITCLTRKYSFDSYLSVLKFHETIGLLAEKEQHHPEMTTQWGSVSICWWTHTVSGLHMNDFVLAAKCDEVFASF